MAESTEASGEELPQRPLVSVVIPVYRREALIAPCIESALAQTWPNLEVVVVDNASDDRTFEVCQRFAAADRRVRVFRNESNVGPVRNWARCFAEARGDFAKILFSDDLLAPRCVERLMALMTSEAVAFAFSSVSVAPRPWDGPPWYRWRGRGGHVSSRRFIEDMLSGARGSLPVSPGAALFRLEELRLHLTADIPSPTFRDFADHGAGPDMLLSLRAAERHPLVGFTPDVLSCFRMHGSSITMSAQTMVAERYRQARLSFAAEFEGGALLPGTLVSEWVGARCPGGLAGIQRFASRYLRAAPTVRPIVVLIEAGRLLARRLRPRVLMEAFRVAAWLARLRLERIGGRA